jgi:hypothetical protein
MDGVEEEFLPWGYTWAVKIAMQQRVAKREGNLSDFESL